MALQELTQLELEEVAGAGLLGNSIQAGSNLVAGLLNAVAPLGKAISLIPGVGIVHYLGDAVIQTATDAAYNLGSSVGGNLNKVDMHFNQENADGTYDPRGIFKLFG